MLIIGERINSTRESIARAIAARDAGHIQREALAQIEAGSDYVDVNAGAFAGEEPELLAWLVRAVQEVTDKPLCLDTANAQAAAAALKVHKGKALINSVTGQKERYQAFLPLVKEYGCGIIALCLDDSGTPGDVPGRLAIARRLIENLTAQGIAPADIYIDPLVHPLSVETKAGLIAIDTIASIAQEYPQVGTIVGLSNISFGLPARARLNRLFLVLALAHGLKAAILDPTDKRMMADLATAETILGQDEYCVNYLTAYRAGKFNL
ncbi:MAG TPA: dihydropteroate synthase [Dehalococcoidia bacterium]|nr:dihydropteroate synthase [Dehalococcoidia bacterium]